MKRILSGMGTLFAWAFGLLIIVAVLPVVLVAVAIFGSINLYAGLWTRIRHDPKRDDSFDRFAVKNWSEETTKDGFIDAFKAISGAISELGGADPGEIEYQGFDVFDDPDSIKGWSDLTIIQTLSSKHAQIRLRFDFGVYYNEYRKERIVTTSDEDDCCGDHPHIVATVIKPDLHTKRHFTLSSSEDIWAVISFLRGQVKFTHKGGQLWMYVPECNAWLVQYHINKSNYGVRASFDNLVAHQYGRDKA